MVGKEVRGAIGEAGKKSRLTTAEVIAILSPFDALTTTLKKGMRLLSLSTVLILGILSVC
jgi:hypothetical protein